jgi:hypothetical protein
VVHVHRGKTRLSVKYVCSSRLHNNNVHSYTCTLVVVRGRCVAPPIMR